MREEKTFCDFCSSDLTCTDCLDRYILVVDAEKLSKTAAFVVDVYILPPIERQLHFCGSGCLREYFNKHYPKPGKD